MKFHIKNLGKIKQADIEVKDLTIICGPNSASKTWLSYSIYHHLNDLYSVIKTTPFNIEFKWIGEPKQIDINSKIFDDYLREVIKLCQDKSNLNIHRTFNTYPGIFLKSKVSTSDVNEYIEILKEIFLNAKYDMGLTNSKYRLKKDSESSTINIEIDSLDIIDTESGEAKLEAELHDYNESVNILLIALMRGDQLDTSNKLPNRPFVITSERVGSLVFQKDIDGTSLSIKEALESVIEKHQGDDEIQSIVRELNQLTVGQRASLAVPVRKNLLAVRQAENELKKQSYLALECPYVKEALDQIVKGKFSVESGSIVYTANDNSHQLPITITSSSIKSLFMIDLYINSLAQEGDVLLIDEPELNLHPDNQRLIAYVIARIANSGIKVLITTHSDYLVREINNCITLSHDFEGKQSLMAKHSLTDKDILRPDQVIAYSVDESGSVQPMEMLDTGIDSRVFDNIILQANDLQEEIFDISEL